MSTQRIDGKISTTVKLENTEPPSRRNSKSKPRAERVSCVTICKSVWMHAVRLVLMFVIHQQGKEDSLSRGWNPCFFIGQSTEPTHQRMWDNPWRRLRGWKRLLSWSNRSLKTPRRAQPMRQPRSASSLVQSVRSNHEG